MSTILAAIAGAIVGAVVSLAANIFVLPWVIRQNKTQAANRGATFETKDEQLMVRVYRYLMPPCFIGVFAVASAFQFGELA